MSSSMEVAIVTRPYWRPTHRRNDSGELDVFEAAKYFSEEPDQVLCGFVGAALAQMNVGGEIVPINGIEDHERKSIIGIPMGDQPPLSLPPCKSGRKQLIIKEMTVQRSSKQPSSPGGKLASFLNSFFKNQAAAHRKKLPNYSIKDENNINPDGRRKIRRGSSNGHFGGKGISHCSRSFYSSTASSGFTTSPTISQTPATRNQKDVRLLSDQRSHEIKHLSRKLSSDYMVSSTDNRSTCSDIGYYKKMDKSTRSFAFATDIDEGAESDSSSDLFELPNYDVGICSKGLPAVYQTTHVRRIKLDANPVQVAPSIIA